MQMNSDHRCPRGCECFPYRVYCRGLRSPTFPEGLPPRTEILTLSGFSIHRLQKSSFEELPRLRQLFLPQNEIEEVEDGAFENLSKLQYLDMSGNWLTCLSANAFSGLEQLKTLILSNNRIRRILPELFDRKPNLQKLDLAGNPLTCDCYLVALRQKLTNIGKLSVFSESSARCNLMDVKVSRANVENIGQIFCPDSTLASLSPLSCLKPSCDSICSCHSGGYVSCTRKGLTTVPDDLPLNTTNLNLAGNKLKILRPGIFGRYLNLRKLNLEGNNIEKIAPGAFKNLSQLSSLYLTSNRIKSITSDTFREVSSLTVLYLQRNEISCVDPDAFSAIPGLRILHLSDNRIETLDVKVFRRQKDLQFLYLIKNPWQCDCHLAWLPAYLKRREAGDNEWAVCRSPASLEGTFVRNLTVSAMQCPNTDDLDYSLRPLKCRDEIERPQQMPQNQEPVVDTHCPEKCVCSELTTRVQRSVITLTATIPTSIESREPMLKVDCANAALSEFPPGIPDNTKELYLNNNSLTAINRSLLGHLRHLEVLSLHDNKLSCLASDTFTDLSNLRVLLLHSNRLQCISNATFNLRKLEHISFDENPFLCYCNMQWLPDWMRRNRHRIAISPHPPTCRSPPSLAGAPIANLSSAHFVCPEEPQQTMQETNRNAADGSLQAGRTTLPAPPLGCSGATGVCCSESSPVCSRPVLCPKPCVCKNDQVDCSYRHLREVPPGIPEDTKDLFLEHNEITWIHSERIERLTKLETLILSYNSIMEIPPGLFTNLRKMKSLILNNNKIQCIHPQAFAGLKQLRVLILQSNDISTMENGTFRDLQQLNNIAIGQNPLHCDCNLQWLQNFFRARFLDNGVAQCSTPKSMEFKSIFHAHPSNFTCPGLLPLGSTAEAGGGLRLGAMPATTAATSRPTSFATGVAAHALAKCSPCTPNPCQGGGECQPVTSLRFICHCKAPFYGDMCEHKMNACFGQPCRNGGTCKFIDDVGHYTCLCPRGFVGKNCEINVNDCSPNVCKNGGKCKDGINSYICECAPGFRGKHCETAFKYCDDVNPCKNDGVCIMDGATDYGCVCQAGWAGKDCSENLNDCEYNQCRNGALCVDQLNDYSCKCLHGYTGRLCEQAVEVYSETPPDHSQLRIQTKYGCKYNRCQNGANCVTDQSVIGYHCVCLSGYAGAFCEKLLSISLPNLKSYLAVEPISRGALVPRGNLSLVFSTFEHRGVILYFAEGADETVSAAGAHEKWRSSNETNSRFFAAELYQGHVKLTYALGARSTAVAYSTLKVNDGNRHQLDIVIQGKSAEMYVDGSRNALIQATASERTSYTSSASLNVDGKSHGANPRPLALTRRIYLAGGPNDLLATAKAVGNILEASGLTGCIREFQINNEKIDFSQFSGMTGRTAYVVGEYSPGTAIGVLPGCPNTPHGGTKYKPGDKKDQLEMTKTLHPRSEIFALSAHSDCRKPEQSCLNGGVCVPDFQMTTATLIAHVCTCPPGFEGPRCQAAPNGSYCRRQFRSSFLHDPINGCISTDRILVHSCSGSCHYPDGTPIPWSPDRRRRARRRRRDRVKRREKRQFAQQMGDRYSLRYTLASSSGTSNVTCCQPVKFMQKNILFRCPNGRQYFRWFRFVRKCACSACEMA
ncbi:hypothetical protein AAHC03_04868 [Spirometra sp. Aus1]